MRRLGALVAALVLAGCGIVQPAATPTDSPASPGASPSATASASPGGTTPSPAPTETPGPTTTLAPCAAEAAALSLREQAGQVVMVGVSGSLDAAERRAITGNRVGSVILIGTSRAGATATGRLTRQLGELARDVPLLVAVDQEGGTVQRLQGPGFDRIPAAADQAELGDAELTRRATRWGRQLRNAGVHLNLAPVADVVPRSKQATNQPVARLRRGYGSDPDVVAGKVTAFAEGMRRAGVAATVKHFPGLGQVTGNTDFATRVLDSVTTADHPGLLPFRRAVEDGVAAVMISSAVYRRIDPDHVGVFSRPVIEIVRDWGFDGVVISDDLGAAAALRSTPARLRALTFVVAGGDLVITADPRLVTAMVDGLVARARKEPDVARQIERAAARVLRLKAEVGLLECR